MTSSTCSGMTPSSRHGPHVSAFGEGPINAFPIRAVHDGVDNSLLGTLESLSRAFGFGKPEYRSGRRGITFGSPIGI